jgi:hypothetical protein
MVPVGNNLLYMEPIFLAAEADAIPELRRFVVSDGHRVVMDPTLDGAIGVLTGESVPVSDGTRLSEVLDMGADPSQWPVEALELLDQADQRLRSGDWEGFGRALEELRRLLEGAAGSGGQAGGDAVVPLEGPG